MLRYVAFSLRDYLQSCIAGCPSRLRIFERECRFCGAARRGRHRIHRPTGLSHCQHGLQKVCSFHNKYDDSLHNPHPQRVQDDHVQYVHIHDTVYDRIYVLPLDAGVPVVPGYHGSNQDADFLAEEANKIG